MNNNCLKLASWNTSGWSGRNQAFRQEIIYRLSADVVFLGETKTTEDTKVDVEDYITIANNRVDIHYLATGGSGGTSFLIKREVLDEYSVTRLHYVLDGLLVIRLVNKKTDRNVTIAGVHLPPESSVHCIEPDDFFQHLLSMCYDHVEDDCLIFCGDFNARVGNKCDFIQDIDEIPNRVVTDTGYNDHGRSLIDFCLQSNTCIVNGRINPLNDGFTSISHRGKSTVDYVICRHEDINLVRMFKVINVNDFIAEHQLSHMAENRVSDHSILAWELYTTAGIEEGTGQGAESPSHDKSLPRQHQTANSCSSELPTRYKKGTLLNTFLSSVEVTQHCEELIDKLLDRQH